MSKRTDKTRAVRGALNSVLEFYIGSIPFCERCKSTEPPLHPAHSYKKSANWNRETFPLDDDDPDDWKWWEVGCLCERCHNWQEGDPEKLQKIIAPRNGRQMRALALNRGWYERGGW